MNLSFSYFSNGWLKSSCWVCWLFFLAATTIRGQLTDALPQEVLVRTVPPWQGTTVQGDLISLAARESDDDQSTELTIVCFLGNDCPMARLYVTRLNEIAQRYQDQNVRVIGINSNPQDSIVSIRKTIADLEIAFPIVKDGNQNLLEQFSATRTPEVFLLDSQAVIRYHGRIDDQYLPGIVRPTANRPDLELAIQQLLAGEQVEVPQTEFAGCLIGRLNRTSAADDGSPGADVTFSQDVAPVLQRHCIECHRDNDIAPFSLVDFQDALGWADMIVEVVDSGFMPPWHANPQHGDFVNQRLMPEQDKQILRDWLAAGTPAGNLDKLPSPSEPAKEWSLPREPDLVVSMSTRPFPVPASGAVDYQYYVVDPGLKEGRWIVGAEIIPGNRSVVHHSIVFIRPPDGENVDGLGWLAAYVPGQRPSPYPPGHGRWIPAGSKLVFQQHYTPNGRAQEDITKIGLTFADADEIDHQIFTLMGINQEFEIPPYAFDHLVNGSIGYLPKQGKLLGISPHMHYRGRSFRLIGHREDESEVLLDVDRYDFNWQHLYELRHPRPLSDFQKIDFECTFDNSVANRANPDASQLVTWGDQSWEEMAVVYMDVSQPLQSQAADTAPATQVAAETEHDPDAHYSDAERQMAREFVDDFFQRFDPQGTGQIPLSRLPEAMRRFGDLDLNRDKVITRDEIEFHARQRFEWFEERQQQRRGR